MSNSTQIFTCGPPVDHECDDNGPVVYGLTNGEITADKQRAQKEGHSWGSVTCSRCGMSAMDRSLWRDE